MIVQRSRSYVIESQKKEHGNTVSFPKRNKPIVADYSILSTYGSLLDMIEKAFNRADPLFNLVVYNPINFYRGDDEIDEFLRTPQECGNANKGLNFLNDLRARFLLLKHLVTDF